MYSIRAEIFAYTKSKYKTEPEYLWSSTPDAAVLRHSDNRKWYAIVMQVPYDKLGIKKSGVVDILNVKCEPLMIGSLLLKDGYARAYHMNKEKWISVMLDGSVGTDETFLMLDISFALTSSKAKRSGK